MKNLYIHFSESTESIRPNLPQHLVELNSEHFAKLQDSFISQSYDQNKFLIVFIKENEAFFDKKQAWMHLRWTDHLTRAGGISDKSHSNPGSWPIFLNL